MWSRNGLPHLSEYHLIRAMHLRAVPEPCMAPPAHQLRNRGMTNVSIPQCDSGAPPTRLVLGEQGLKVEALMLGPESGRPSPARHIQSPSQAAGAEAPGADLGAFIVQPGASNASSSSSSSSITSTQQQHHCITIPSSRSLQPKHLRMPLPAHQLIRQASYMPHLRGTQLAVQPNPALPDHPLR